MHAIVQPRFNPELDAETPYYRLMGSYCDIRGNAVPAVEAGGRNLRYVGYATRAVQENEDLQDTATVGPNNISPWQGQ